MIPVEKSKIIHALGALGKVVCRTSPVEAFRSLRIEGKDGRIVFQTVGLDETITYTLPVEGVEEFQTVVNFDEFRTVARACRNKSVALIHEEGRFVVDHSLMSPLKVDWPEEHHEEGQFEIAELPQNFVSALATAAPIVSRNEPRRVLQGIHLCKEGIVVTNGRELLNIGMPLNLAPLTIPFPHALLATKSEESGRIVAWCEREDRFFRFEFDNWTWSGKALSGDYPNWKHVMPDVNYLPYALNLDVDRAAQLEIFLKNIPDSPPNNPVTLAQGDDGTLNIVSDTGSKTSVVAEFPNNWGEFTLTVNKTLLLRLLGEGHHRIACGDAHLPFIATGGIGTYIAMPLNVTKNNVQPQPKEEKTMNETNPAVAAPVQPVEHTNPLDDLAAAVEGFKNRLRAMSEESTALSRKVREAALVQKQKEREFVHTQRVLERVRMAI